LANNADVNKANNGEEPLSAHITKQKFEMLWDILQKKQMEINGLICWTPLNWASWEGHRDVIQLLLANNADVNKANNGGKTPLWESSGKGHSDVVQLLLANNADVNKADSAGKTPLYWASRMGHSNVIQLLLANNADVNMADNDGWTPLHWASGEGHSDIVQLLLDNNADVNKADNDGFGLTRLTRMRRLTRLSEGFAGGAGQTVKIGQKVGKTPLFWASGQDHSDVVQLLLANNADVNKADNDEKKCKLDNYKKKYLYVSEIILIMNDLEAAHNYCMTLLFQASEKGHCDVVQLLLANNADVNQADKYGETPLLWASGEGQSDVV
ncbi:unnamed protein product, partial [Meganyctiphanes norvegica]